MFYICCESDGSIHGPYGSYYRAQQALPYLKKIMGTDDLFIEEGILK